jgi:hypothetical protein
VFLVAAPLDVINHRVNGLDLTAWSPSHMMLYIGTVLMLIGVIDGWLGLGRGGFVLGALFFFLLEDVWFSAGQQEYGVLELESWLRGTPYAEPELLSFAAKQINRDIDLAAVQHFALPIHEWVYPAWGIVAAGIVLALARKAIGRAWAASAVVGAYVLYRSLLWPALVGTGFPPSAVPFWLLFIGVAVDVAFLVHKWRWLAGAALVTVIGGGALWAQSELIKAPPVQYWPTLPLAFVVLAALWWSGGPLAKRLNRNPIPTQGTPEPVPTA